MVFRVDKNRDYSTINNTVLRDKRLSLKAKGLLVTMLSLPDDWDYSIEGLSAILKEGRDAIRSAIQELEKFNYVERVQDRSEGGNFNGYVYIIHETPCLENTEVPPLTENPTTVNPTTENSTQLNTNKLNTKESTTTTKSNISSFERHGKNHSVKLTEEEFRKLIVMFGAERAALMIQRLDYYITKTGTYYPNHYQLICKWIIEDDSKLEVGSDGT